jgi:hypothetical protein
MLVKPLNRDAKTALDRYVALTGDAQASRQDPAVRRFFDGFESLGERESAQGRLGRPRTEPRTDLRSR